MNPTIATAYHQLAKLVALAERGATEGHGPRPVHPSLLRACPELSVVLAMAAADESRHHWARVGAPGSWLEYAGEGDVLLREASHEALQACSVPGRWHVTASRRVQDAADREIVRRLWTHAKAGDVVPRRLRRVAASAGHRACGASRGDVVAQDVARRLGLCPSESQLPSEQLAALAA